MSTRSCELLFYNDVETGNKMVGLLVVLYRCNVDLTFCLHQHELLQRTVGLQQNIVIICISELKQGSFL